MTGTACEFNELEDDIYSTALDIDVPVYPDHLGIKKIDEIDNCFLTDLSRCGAAVLIPRSISPYIKNMDMRLLSPEDDEEVLTVLKAEQRWVEEDHTEDHHKIGIKFMNTCLSEVHAIDALIQLFMQQKIVSLKCELLYS